MSHETTRGIAGFVKWVVGVAIVGILVTLLITAFFRDRQEEAAEEEQEQPAAVTSRVNSGNGEILIALDSETQSLSGIKTSKLAFTTQREEARTSAVILSVQSLTQIRTNYLSAVAQVDKTKAALDVSEPEYERLKRLYEDNQNASAKALQTAEGLWRSDQVSLRAANEALQLNGELARQTWGEVIAKWISDGLPALDRVLSQQNLLLQVYSPPIMASPLPKSVSVQTLNGRVRPAEFVSAFPAVDPRIQASSFLYTTSSVPELSPGMTVTVLLPSGPKVRGAIVPNNAVVWLEGKAWAYVQISPGRFARREISTETPNADGWFVSSGFVSGENVVTRGAQELLSEEFRTQIEPLAAR